MPVPASLGQLSQTASMNSPAGGENVFPDQDDYERQQFANDAILRDGAHQWLTGVSGTNTVTGSTAAASAVSAYAAGQVFRFVAAGANTGAVTLNVNGLGARAVAKRGATDLAAGDIAAGSVVTVTYDGTQFQMLDPADAVQTSGNQTVAGVKTFTSPPVVPTATASNQAVNKGQMDAAVAAAVLAALPAGIFIDAAWETPPAGMRVLRNNGQAVSLTTYSGLLSIYCGDAKNPVASWAYRCTDPANPTTTRSTTGDYIVLPKSRGRYRRDVGDGSGIGNGLDLHGYYGDAIRNITGQFVGVDQQTNGTHVTGAFLNVGSAAGDFSSPEGSANPVTTFDASRVVPTAEENRPYTYLCTSWITY